MELKTWALIFSFVAMLLIAGSYFAKTKGGFLVLQGSGIVFLMASYFCNRQYFPVVGLTIGLARCFIFYLYERKGKETPILWCYLLCVLSFAAYGVINLWILQDFHPADILYLIGLVLYMFIFRIRNIKTVRYAALVPAAISIAYNVWTVAPIFAVISYCFEMLANIIAILKYHVFGKPNEGQTR